MTFHHAIPLALLGWYLIVPPMDCSKVDLCLANPDAPISQWGMVASYDSEGICDEHLKTAPGGQCVSSGDARWAGLPAPVAQNPPNVPGDQ